MEPLIIFDCDGVLVDSEAISNGVIAEMLTELGWPTSTEEAVHIFAGTTLDLVCKKLEAKTGKKAPSDFEQEYRQKCTRRFQEELQPIKGIKNALLQIPQEKSVASNGPLFKIEMNLKLTGLSHFFGTSLYSAYDIQKWKPKPDLYLYVAHKMGRGPEQCVVIEDSPHGVLAGVQAGMKVFGYAGQTSADRLRENGAEVFEDMVELPDLIQKFY